MLALQQDAVFIVKPPVLSNEVGPSSLGYREKTLSAKEEGKTGKQYTMLIPIYFDELMNGLMMR